MTGIYKITNIINNKCYIGKSETNIKIRWYRHKSKLRNNRHINKNGKQDKLQNAWNKYSEENFTFEIIEECLPEECCDKEIYWIAYYDSYYNGYNQTKGGEGLSGHKHTEETKNKISESNKGKSKQSPWKDKKLSEEHKQKISEKISEYWRLRRLFKELKEKGVIQV